MLRQVLPGLCYRLRCSTAVVLPRALASSAGLPELTKDRYPYVRRGAYGTLSERHVRQFGELLGTGRVLTDPTELAGYNVDWIKNVRGYSSCVLKPKSTEEVSEILKYCNAERLAVCPQGGNTGLVGGSVPVFDEVILSTALMNQIITLDEASGILVCQAGCILESLENYLDEYDLVMPLDLGAKGSCHIGGNVSTNAGGLRLVRYGNLHGNVLGVEAVKADGEIIDCLSTLKKDNTGYHLKHLFIGSEGTLGVVTKVAIQCPTKSKAISLAFLALDSFDQILKTFRKAKEYLGEILSSCEMADSLSLDCVTGNLKVKSPLGDYPFYMFIETSGSNSAHDEEKLNKFLEEVMQDGTVLDGTITNEPGRMKHIWQLRERIAEGVLHDGYVLKYDISFPLESFYSIVPDMTARLGSDSLRCCGYGHIGDGNLHLNISLKNYDTNIVKKIEPYVYEYTSKFKGSISAEHGIGFKKPNYMHYSKSSTAINLMKDIKLMMDPNGILNPYKVLPMCIATNVKLCNNIPKRYYSTNINKMEIKYNIKRGNYSILNEKHILYFKDVLGEQGLKTDSTDLDAFNTDWFKHHKGSSKIVLQPKTTNEISKILSYCNENKLAVCPQGGNTSISGGSIPVFDEIILSLSRMDKIIKFDDKSDTLVCEAGCILENLNNFLTDKGLMIPLDLASKGSCQIGGNLSTNAGGLRLLRYGNLHGSVLGVEAVKANGEVIDCLNTLRKDNTGYHLKHLFIGSEGTLGILSKVAIQCVALPKFYNVALLGLESFDKVLDTFQCAKYHLNEILSACEMMDYQSMDMVQSNLKIKNQIGDYPFYMLLEAGGSNEKHNDEKLNVFLEECLRNELILNGTTASEPGRCKALWEIRERVAESIRLDGYVLLYDLSFPLKDFYTIVPEMKNVLNAMCHRVCGLGHLGDGNLHLQISLKEFDADVKKHVDDIVNRRVSELKGSISAEHGIGFLKTDLLKICKSDSSIHLMREVKKLLDPNCILNPYKVINM